MANQLRTSIHNNNLYWTLQLSGWTIFFVAYSGIGIIVYEFDWRIVVNYFFVTVTGILLSHIYRLFIKKREWQKQTISKLALRILLAPVILALIWQLSFLPVSLLLSTSERELTLGYFFAMTFNLSVIFFLWNLIYFFYKLFTSYKQSEIEKWRLTAAVKDAQLIALKSQINPHFIFNSLNNIRSLVVENPEKAREMITHLSSLLRYSIQFNSAEKVTISNEIDIVKYYLNLESIQFESRLKFEFYIDDKALNYKIPPMAIQMLVENAIKHGISKLPDGGEISVSCQVNSEILEVEVINTGQLAPLESSETGIGLKNATDRLKLLFGRLSELTLENINSHQVRAKFTVPLN